MVAPSETAVSRQIAAIRAMSGEGEDLPDLPVAPDLLVWLGGRGQVEITECLQTVNPDTGLPDLQFKLSRIVRAASDGHVVEKIDYLKPVFRDTDLNDAHSFLQQHKGQEFCCPDGDFVDQTQMLNNLSEIGHALGRHTEGKY